MPNISCFTTFLDDKSKKKIKANLMSLLSFQNHPKK